MARPSRTLEIMKINAEGQITIPIQIREQFGLTPGANVEAEVSKDGILIKPMPTHREQVVRWLKDEHGSEMATLTTDQIMQLIH